MKILILGLNYAPERVGIAVYTTGMAEGLAGRGHEVRVVAGRPYYPGWKAMAGHNAFAYGGGSENGVDVLRVPHYIPARPTGAKRLLHHASFALASLSPMVWRAAVWRPDVVLAVAPSLIAAPVAWLAAALCGAQSWLHIQDFEVEAAFATGLVPRRGWMARLASRFERGMLRTFDTVSTISPRMGARLMAKGIAAERVFEFRNWADIDAIRPLEAPSPYRARWGIRTPHVALYAGSIGNKQGMEIVLAAARRLRDRKDLTFVICGEGPHRAALERAASGLGNICFFDLQPPQNLNALLGLATMHLLPQSAGAADLVLPSKLANMLASGRPVVATAAKGTGLHDEVEGCGIVTPPGDGAAFAEAIVRLADNPALAARHSRAARARAVARWGGRGVLAGLEARLLALAEPAGARQPDPAE